MKIQLSPTRIVPGVITVWSEPGPEVDMVMNLHDLTFREGSIDEMYVFHVLDHLFPHEALSAMQNWNKCLKVHGRIFNVVDDFEFLCRLFIGGEIDIVRFNSEFSHPTQYTRDSLAELYYAIPFPKDEVVQWNVDIPDLFPKKDHEIVMSAVKA